MAMKQSGIEWVQEIPSHWDVMPNKYIMKKKKRIQSIYDGSDILSLTIDGVVVRDLDAGGKMPTSFDGYQRIEKGNLLMCLFDYDVTPRCIGLIKNDGLTSPAYSQFEMKNSNYAPYYYYYYLMIDHTKELLHLAKNLRHSFTEDQLGMIKTPVPPVDEQKAIAHYLDNRIDEIDNLSSLVKKEIETLERYKKSLIVEAVTNGMDSRCKKKNSQLDWIGEIPETWKVEKIKYHLKRKEPKNPGNKQVLSVYREYGVIPKDSRDDNHNVTSEDVSKYKYVIPGNLVINKMKAWQGSMGVSDYEGIVSPAYYIYTFTDESVDKKYLHHLLRSCYKNEFRRLSGGIREGQWDLSSSAFENTMILMPDIYEQRAIVSYIEEETTKLEKIINEKVNQLSVLDQYKKSLIYEYVTGKKVVPQ